MDWLEKEWYDKFRSLGMNASEAELMARLKAAMERDESLKDKIRNEGFNGFKRWIEIHCKDIYYAIKNALNKLWEKIKGWFS